MEEWARWAVPKASSGWDGGVSSDLFLVDGFTGTSVGGRTDEDISKVGKALAELLYLGLVGLDLVALGIDALALLLNVEAEVLEENDIAVACLGYDILNLGAYGVGGEGDLLAEELLELADNGL